ncbi:MAG TPA: metallophosphoesterase [Pseudomonadota bacterium]|nr:metallophosphoesterase [Pseudomonadota bacterium]
MRIAHISDLHAFDLTDAALWQFVSKRSLGLLNLWRKRAAGHPLHILDALCRDLNRVPLDHIVATGDLTNLSLPGELKRARAAFDSLRLGPQAISVIPGNHDVYVWEAYLRRYFEGHFAPYCTGDDAAAENPRFPYVRVRGEVAIIGCSTALPSPPPLADGWLGRRQLQAIGDALTAQADRFRILLIHHPPLPQSLDLLRALRDRGALRRLLAEVGCELVLHGHEHRDVRSTLPGPRGDIPVIGVGSGTYSDPRPERAARYNIYTVEKTAGSTRFVWRSEQRVFSPSTGEFGYLPSGSSGTSIDSPHSAPANG